MDFDALILASRLATHLATAFIVASYFGNPDNWRPGIGLAAWALAGSSFALAMQIMTGWYDMVANQPQPWLLIFSLSVLGIVARARGNIAKIFSPPWRW